jgi:hypothetical protein
MIETRGALRLLPALLVVVLAGLCAADEQKKDAKKAEKGKKGTVVGVLTAKGDKDNWLEVKADGEEKGRRYSPHWRSISPGVGGLDKKMLATIKKLKVGSRLRLEWTFDERARIEKVEVLKEAPAKKDGDKGKDK